MLRSTRVLGHLSVGVACRVLGLRAPPKNQKLLKKTFVELAKQHHPDQNADNVAASTKRMVAITEAYQTVKQYLEQRGHARDLHNSKDRTYASSTAATEGNAMRDMEDVATSFQAPGSSLSLRGFNLPWQRSPSSSSVAAILSRIEEAHRHGSFSDYVSAVRAAESARRDREDRAAVDAAMAEGSHGFTREHFAEVDRMQQGLKGLPEKLPTGVIALGWRFYTTKWARQCMKAPRRCWEAARYIVLG